MKVTEQMIEAAEAMVARERDCSIALIQAELAAEGEDVCVECDEPISAARKAALPSAERCIDCQKHYERTMRVA
ncbi:MAG: TraR/DksA C4-type zinc finger protein [Sphingomonadales bacterium]|nr:TraR/DksA C4-type zinc finger protein [Sphingomonadales bacterium]MDE2171344.1 TraR/DksA C4-type zinc finger protein [Sphingomonadales bacterium]